MTTDYDTRVSVSPQPPQDGRWAIFVPARNMPLGDAELPVKNHKIFLKADLERPTAAHLKAPPDSASSSSKV